LVRGIKQQSLLRNLLEFPGAFFEPAVQCADPKVYERACEAIAKAERITIKYGRGALGCGAELSELAELIDAAIVGGPSASGVVPFSNPRYMTVGGSKGSSAGNYAMEEADLVIVVGARAVCQWDSSGTAFKKVAAVINMNLNLHHAFHYNRSIGITGDAKSCLAALIAALKERGFQPAGSESPWAKSLFSKRAEWLAWKQKITESEPLYDETFQAPVLTQPAAIAQACRFADSLGAVKFFDAGDVQANGFQIIEDEKEGQTITDTGSSYMGFAASALLAPVISGNGDRYAFAFCGDGSFMMNPQVLIDGVEHGVKGCIIIFDNRSMAAISGLQKAQYGQEYKTRDRVAVDYAAFASAVQGVKGLYGGRIREEFAGALQSAAAHAGLSVIHLPVYGGDHPAGGMGVFGDWNVGNWCERVQAEHHKLGL
jgi:thiamine pyrophosphate-dependent acetolactate synthase large subunit-like protein